jgi:hypothetical protein
METKLTLKIKTKTIEKGKRYAKKKKTSLSRLVENYIERLSSDAKEEHEITPLVKSLSGIVHLKEGFNFKTEYTKFLSKKYS